MKRQAEASQPEHRQEISITRTVDGRRTNDHVLEVRRRIAYDELGAELASAVLLDRLRRRVFGHGGVGRVRWARRGLRRNEHQPSSSRCSRRLYHAPRQLDVRFAQHRAARSARCARDVKYDVGSFDELAEPALLDVATHDRPHDPTVGREPITDVPSYESIRPSDRHNHASKLRAPRDTAEVRKCRARAFSPGTPCTRAPRRRGAGRAVLHHTGEQP